MAAIGSGLGSGGFMVLDDLDDLTAVVAGVSWFLAVESCGQCTPCKQDGRTLAESLRRLSCSEGDIGDVDEIRLRVTTVTDGARCSLATQQQVVVSSLLDRFPTEVDAHASQTHEGVEPVDVAELVDIVDGVARIDERHRSKQPDWTYDAEDSGKSPADRLGEHRRPETLPES